MSEQQTTAGAVTAAGDDGRIPKFVSGVEALRVPSAADQTERRLYWLGILLPIVGLIVIWVAWWGASGTKYVYQEVPYIISGGIFGVSLVLIGAALFARYSVARLLRFWLARLVAEQQAQTDRIVEALGSGGRD